MHKDLIKYMPWLISMDCTAHQLNLVTADLLKLKDGYLKTVNTAIDVIKWFNNHSRALGLLCKEQLQTYQKTLSLIQPCITRWTCHFLSSQWLLETSGALCSCCIKEEKQLITCAGERQQDKSKVQTIIRIVSDTTFWDDITMYVSFLQAMDSSN